MNPIVFKNGSIQIHAFTGWIMVGVALGVAILLLTAWTYGKRGTWLATCAPWLDVAIAAVIAGIIGARIGHVGLNWTYFAAHTDQITDLSTGGLDWHAAVILGVPAAIGMAARRRVPLRGLLNALAFALPLGAIAAWEASVAASAVYGLEVRTLADFPAWLVIESPDIYGITAPRLNLLPAGLALSGVVLLVVVILSIGRRLSGSRFYLALALYSLGQAVIDVFRADYIPSGFGHRADQLLDLALALAAILCFALPYLARMPRRRKAIQTVSQGV
ncbi:MAG TPA: prolipoprotein diacylglyceryl transferase family protein [Aggregatilineales bacterium]|nr:prolipoprotein diacylglyceryl transferase family protein [Aggregatilineales bacterium]